jgi:hypothetical protein
MMPNRTYELRNLYFQQSCSYGPQVHNSNYPHLLNWPANGYFDRLKPDAELLQEALIPIIPNINETTNISQQIFGNDIKQQHVGLQHLSNLFTERCSLHKKHIDEIQHRDLRIQEMLYGVVINRNPDRAKQMSSLETQLLQLENSKREEELAFWKDTAELREKLFEAAASYRGSKQRYSLFAGMEDSYGGQG